MLEKLEKNSKKTGFYENLFYKVKIVEIGFHSGFIKFFSSKSIDLDIGKLGSHRSSSDFQELRPGWPGSYLGAVAAVVAFDRLHQDGVRRYLFDVGVSEPRRRAAAGGGAPTRGSSVLQLARHFLHETTFPFFV